MEGSRYATSISITSLIKNQCLLNTSVNATCSDDSDDDDDDDDGDDGDDCVATASTSAVGRRPNGCDFCLMLARCAANESLATSPMQRAGNRREIFMMWKHASSCRL